MAEEIIQSLRALANKIENLGENADELIVNDKDLASDFHNLLEVVPARWKKSKGNRLFEQVKKRNTPAAINDDHKKVIWNWRLNHEIFCSRQATRENNLDDTSPLDGIVSGIENDDTDLVLSSVHWRISLLVITLVKNSVCKDTEDPEVIANYFLSNGLLSAHRSDYFKQHVSTWLHGGKKYEDLSRNMGGYGCLIYLPDIGRSNYELYYHPTKDSALSTIGALTTKVTPAAAQKFEGFSSHDVVNGIVSNVTDRIRDFRLIIISIDYADMQQPRSTSQTSKKRHGRSYTNNRRQSKRRVLQPNEDQTGLSAARVNVSQDVDITGILTHNGSTSGHNDGLFVSQNNSVTSSSNEDSDNNMQTEQQITFGEHNHNTYTSEERLLGDQSCAANEGSIPHRSMIREPRSLLQPSGREPVTSNSAGASDSFNAEKGVRSAQYQPPDAALPLYTSGQASGHTSSCNTGLSSTANIDISQSDTNATQEFTRMIGREGGDTTQFPSQGFEPILFDVNPGVLADPQGFEKILFETDSLIDAWLSGSQGFENISFFKDNLYVNR